MTRTNQARPARVARRALVRVTLAAAVGACARSGQAGPPAPSTIPSSASTTSEAASGTTSTSTGAAAIVLALRDDGVAGLRLGMTLEAATATGAIGAPEPGCELAGPGQADAALISPLDGAAIFSDGRLITLHLRGGVEVDGAARVGQTYDAFTAKATSFVAQLDRSYEATFDLWLASFRRVGGEVVFEVTVDPRTGLVDSLGLPSVPFCE